MLYNPRWKDPLLLANLVEFLESKPPEETYNFDNCAGACLLSQYLDSLGMGDHLYGSNPYHQVWLKLHDLYGMIAYGGCNGVHTFGAALARARAFD